MKLIRGLLLISLALFALSCGPTIRAAYMAKDGAGTLKTTLFHDGDEIHCIVEFVGGDEETTLEFSLSGPNGIKLEDNEIYPRPTPTSPGEAKIDEQLYMPDPMDPNRKVVAGPWVKGDYKMEISIDGELEETLEFSIK